VADSRFGILIEALNRSQAAMREAQLGLLNLEKGANGAARGATQLNGASAALSRTMAAVARDVQGSASSLGTFATVLGSIGGPIGAVALTIAGLGVGMVGLARHAGIVEEEMEHLRERLGLSTGAIGALKVAASEMGLSFDSLTPGLTIFNRKIAEARLGIGDADQSFRKLGVAVRNEFTGALLSTETILSNTARKLEEIQDPAERARLAMELFGRSGGRFIAVLSQDLEALKKRAIELGVVFEGDVAIAARKADIAFDRMGTAMKGLTNSLGAIAAIKLQPLIEQLAAVAEWLAKAAKSASELVVTLSKTDDENERLKKAGLVVTPSGVMPRRQAEAEARGDFSARQFAESRRQLGLVNIGTTWPPPGPPMPTQEQWEAMERARAALLQPDIPWGRLTFLGPPSRQFFEEQRHPFSRGFEMPQEMVPFQAEPSVEVTFKQSEKALASLIASLGEDFPEAVAKATDETGNVNEAMLGFNSVMQESRISALQFGIEMGHSVIRAFDQGVSNFVDTVIAGTQRIDQAFGEMIRNIVQRLISDTATNIFTSIVRGITTGGGAAGPVVHQPNTPGGGIGPVQPVAPFTLSSRMPPTVNVTVHANGHFVDRTSLQDFASETLAPLLVDTLNRGSYRGR
jgi:hypothetical protein